MHADWLLPTHKDSCLFNIHPPGGVLRLQHLVIVLSMAPESIGSAQQPGAHHSATPATAHALWRRLRQSVAHLLPGRDAELHGMKRLSQAFRWCACAICCGIEAFELLCTRKLLAEVAGVSSVWPSSSPILVLAPCVLLPDRVLAQRPFGAVGKRLQRLPVLLHL